MTNLEIALSYLEKGLSVIPLYSPEMLKTKPPKSFKEELQRESKRISNQTIPYRKTTLLGK